MNKYLIVLLILLIVRPLLADCPKSFLGAAMTLLAFDRQSDLFDAKEKANKTGKDTGVLSKVLERLGYTTHQTQENFALKLKVNAKLDRDPDFKDMTVDAFDYSLYGPPTLGGHLLVLKVSEPSASENDYYFFQKRGAVYDLVTPNGVEVYSKYCVSFPCYYSFGGEDFVSMMGSGGGTGILECDADLFAVGKNGVKKILSYSMGGDWAESPLIYYEISTGPVSFLKNALTTGLQIPTTVSYSASEREDANSHTIPTIDLFKKVYLLKYEWSLLKQEYVLDPVASGITFPVGNVDVEFFYSTTHEDIFERNYLELRKLAEKGSREQKNWLIEFLNDEGLRSKTGSEEMIELQKIIKVK